MNNQYINDLINRMTDRDDLNHNSAQSSTWKAHREAELLVEENLINELIDFIKAEKNKNKLKNAYFILGKISQNIKSKNALSFLVSRLPMEKDKSVLQVIFDSVSSSLKPADLDISPIINAVDDTRWQVRQAAIRALNYCTHQEAEERLVKVLNESKENIELIFSCSVLVNIGTPYSVIFLERFINSRNQDLKILSREAIEAIKKRNANNYITK